MMKIEDILKKAKTVAMVGLSPRPGRASADVAQYLISQGYTVIPVNPLYDEIMGVKAYPSLLDIPRDIKIDIVDVFRKGEDTPPIAREAAAINAYCLWLQLGIASEKSRQIAQEAGLAFVQDRCMKIEHQAHSGRNK